MVRWITYSMGTLAAVALLGFLLLGGRFASYVRTSARSVQESVQEAVPLEFELRRARDLIDAILPDLQSHVRTIAQEEVAIAALENDLIVSNQRLERRAICIGIAAGQNPRATSFLFDRRSRPLAATVDRADASTFRAIQTG